MRFLLLSIFLNIFYINSKAQPFKLKGEVRNSMNQPIEFVSVFVMASQDSLTPIASTYTDRNGVFIFSKLLFDSVKLYATIIGYNAAHSPWIKLNNKDNHYLIRLEYNNTQLNEVTITAARPIIELLPDKIVYNVENERGAVEINASDLLRKVPYVNVDDDGNITIKGSSSYRVQLNGRNTGMIAKNPKEALKSFPVSLIKKIEVITNPSAKYDAEGIKGIINIITFKKISGYNGSISSSYNSLGSYNYNSSLNAKINSWGIAGFIGSGNQQSPDAINTFQRDLISPDTIIYERFDSKGNNENLRQYGNAEISYDIDTLRSMSIYGNFNMGKNSSKLIGQSNYYRSDWTTILQTSNSSNSLSHNPTWDAGIDYIEIGKVKDREFSIRYNYWFELNTVKNLTRRDFVTSSSLLRQTIDADQNIEHTVQLDYSTPFKTAESIDLGYKFIQRDISSTINNQQYNHDSLLYINIDTINKNFTYRQYINTIYISHSIRLEKINIRTGLRNENTNISAAFGNRPRFHSQYHNIMPNVNIAFTIKDKHNFKFFISNRIQRPWIKDLDPTYNDLDLLSIKKGNPALKPEQYYTMEIEYNTFGELGFLGISIGRTLGYNLIEDYSYYDNQLRRYVTINDNIAKSNTLNCDINTNIKIKKISTYLNLSVNKVYFQNFINEANANTGITGHLYGIISYKNSKRWRLQASGWTGLGQISLRNKSNIYYSYSFMTSKTFVNDKVTLNIAVENPFHKYKINRNEYKDGTIYYKNEYISLQSALKLSLVFRFGKLKESVSRKRGVTNNDKKGSSTSSPL